MKLLSKTNKLIFALACCLCLFKTSTSLAFNCIKATQASELLICSNQKLMQDDIKLNTVFKNTLHRLTQTEKKNLFVEQNDFLSLRDNCTKSGDHATDVICLDKLYKDRIKQLSSWPNDLFQRLVYSNPNQTLVMDVFLNRYDPLYQAKYLTKYELRDKRNNILNRGQFKACTYGGMIMNIVDYIKERRFMVVTPIKNGFAIHSLAGCGAQTIWQLNLITPICTASAPATDDKGNPIAIGNDPQKISFAYLEGFGASRKATNDYFTVNKKGLLRLSQTQPGFRNKIALTCKQH